MGLVVGGSGLLADSTSPIETAGNPNKRPKSNQFNSLGVVRMESSPCRRAVIEPVTKSSHGLVIVQVAAALGGKCAFYKQPGSEVCVEHEVNEVGAVGRCKGRSICISTPLQIKAET